MKAAAAASGMSIDPLGGSCRVGNVIRCASMGVKQQVRRPAKVPVHLQRGCIRDVTTQSNNWAYMQ